MKTRQQPRGDDSGLWKIVFRADENSFERKGPGFGKIRTSRLKLSGLRRLRWLDMMIDTVIWPRRIHSSETEVALEAYDGRVLLNSLTTGMDSSYIVTVSLLPSSVILCLKLCSRDDCRAPFRRAHVIVLVRVASMASCHFYPTKSFLVAYAMRYFDACAR